MITEKQLKIFEVFAKRPFVEYTRKQVKAQAKEKSNNELALAINLLKKEEVVVEKKVGKSGLLRLNLDSDLAIHYVALCNEIRINRMAKLAVESIRKDIFEDTHFYSLVIFGSYATGTQDKDSDLDVALFVEGDDKRKQIEASVRNAELKSVLKLDVHVIPKAEMLQMLSSQDENLGKQIARKHMAIHNHRIFYELIKEGMRHGFRI